MPREKPIRPMMWVLYAWVLAAVALAPVPTRAQSDLDRWQAEMDPADHAHMLGNLADAEDRYLEALKLAERFDRTGGYLERTMAGLGGLYVSQERFAEAASLYRQALTIAEALYDTDHARHGVIAIYQTALAGAEAGNARQEVAKRRARESGSTLDHSAARTRPLTAAPAPVRTEAPPATVSVPARGIVPRQSAAALVSEVPPPMPSMPVLSHYRLAGAAVPPPTPAEVPQVPFTAQTKQSATALSVRPAVPAQPALPPAIDVAEVAAGNAAAEVIPADAVARAPEAEGPPLRGTPPPIVRPHTVAPEEIATISQSPAAEPGTVGAVAETAPAGVRSWDARPVEIAGQPVDAAAIHALAADPAAPPEVMLRAVADETPQQIAQRKALEERHPVLGVRLGEAKRNMGPIYPDTPRLADTEQAYVAELEALERSLGPRHPDVAAMLYKLARLYQRQSRYEPAGRTYERCLALREKILPEGHPDIIETLVNYARLLRASGFSDLAAEMRKRAEAQKAAAN